METIRDVILMMSQGCSFASVDFKHAFFSIKIKHEDICDLYGKATITNSPAYHRALGLHHGYSQKFWNLYVHLRNHGIEISGYIVDSISLCDDYAEHALQMDYAVQFFDQLGFTVNINESVLPPFNSHTIEHLGFVLDSQKMTVTLTDSKKQCIHDLAVKIISTSSLPISDLAQFLGKLVATEPGFTHPPLYYKEIESFKNQQVVLHKGNYNAIIHMPNNIKHQIAWWRDNVHHTCRYVLIPGPEHVIESDASNTGWGGLYDGKFTANGQWRMTRPCNTSITGSCRASFLWWPPFAMITKTPMSAFDVTTPPRLHASTELPAQNQNLCHWHGKFGCGQSPGTSPFLPSFCLGVSIK